MSNLDNDEKWDRILTLVRVYGLSATLERKSDLFQRRARVHLNIKISISVAKPRPSIGGHLG